ncbi:hypothetical protein niasHS_004542 [Heterodera schachtii]|uniref:Gustatory receptor n=1 Tax=Heterodera schachtii TaxID=97005 RepID=A0ABD2JMI5_HETSC
MIIQISNSLLYSLGCIFIRAIVRFEILLENFLTGQIVSANVGVWQTRAMMAPIYFRNYLAHVLVIERLMATLWAKNYETRRNWHFSAIWFSFVTGLTTLNIFHTTSQQVDFLSWLTFGFVLALALIELFLFAFLWKLNIQNYQRKWSKIQNLSERYQLSENVRTTKQMLVPLLLHLINLCLGSAVTTIAFYRPFANKFLYDFLGQFIFPAVSVSNFMIELTMILFHPFLCRRLGKTIEKVRNAHKHWQSVGHANNRIGTTTEERDSGEQQMVILVNLHGEKLRTEPISQTEHFEVLRKAWEEMDKRSEKPTERIVN